MNVLRMVLAVVLSIPIMFFLFPVLSFIWSVLFPLSVQVNQYAAAFASPVHVALPIGSAIFFFLIFHYAEREKLFDPKNPMYLLLFIFIVFLAYYVGLSGFYFFRFTDLTLHGVTFTYFLYVPYWTVLAGLIAAWIAYVVPLPKKLLKFS
ncbi:MAG: hypothetical protein GXO00_00975 [Candidatus Diapherotrites archaeon]|nr:hypothetical protein [Candidatus Diapherotrites archaeon]